MWVLLLSLLPLLLIVEAPASRAATPRLSLSPDGRHFVDPTGQAVLINGDSAWSLFVQPTLAEAQLYLEDRAALGFNFLAVSLIEHKFADNAPANAAGDLPFTGAPFATPNEAYFAHVDTVLARADDLGFTIFLGPVWLGWQCGDEGFCAEIQAASLADMREWGRFVGARYADRDNILWFIGGDADPTPVKDKLREFVAGLREFDTSHLISAHNHRGTQAITYWPGESWLQFNTLFTFGVALYQDTASAYAATPTMPFLMLEGHYEHEKNATLKDLRAQSYWSILTGAAGVVFGNCPIWHFGSTWNPCLQINWQAELSSPGAVQMGQYRKLFESRRWELLVPDSAGQVLVSGAGVFGSEDYALAARASDGSSILAYVPSPRSLSFDTSVLSGDSVRVWWFDPVDASTTLAGDFVSGALVIAPGPAGDQVLVIDGLDQGFAAPGTPLPVSTSAPEVARHRLEQNRPNPFNPSTEIRFTLESAGTIQLVVFDAKGRAVRTLLRGWQEAGAHRQRWDGRDDRGRNAASGVYYYRLSSESEELLRRMVLVH